MVANIQTKQWLRSFYELFCDMDIDISFSGRTVLIAINATSAFCGTLANALIILTIFRSQELRSLTNYFVASLSIMDLLSCIVCQPLFIHSLVVGKLTVALSVFSFFSIFGTLNNLIAVTIERYTAIYHPMKYYIWITEGRVCAVIIVAWSAAVVMSVLVNVDITPRFIGPCYIFITGVIMTLVYLRVYITVRRKARQTHVICNTVWLHKRSTPSHAGHTRTAGQSRAVHAIITNQVRSTPSVQIQEKKTTKTIGLILGCFFICWLPFIFIPALTMQGKKRTIAYMETMAFLSACVDPFVYFWIMPHFRKFLPRALKV